MLRYGHSIEVLGASIQEDRGLAEEIRLVRAFFAANVAPAEPTIALPIHPLYNVLLDRPNPTRYIADHPTGDFTMTTEQKRAEAARLLASPTRFVIVEQSWYARPTSPNPLLAALRAEFHPVRGYGSVLILERGSDANWLAFAARLRRAITTGPTPADVAPWRAFATAHPDEPLAWRMLGLALQASGDAPGAIDELHRAAELDPQDVAPLETTAALLARMNRRKEAIADLRRARAVRSSDALDKLAAQLGVAGE
jgi:tetratricopeptide (TPR) repeat protein